MIQRFYRNISVSLCLLAALGIPLAAQSLTYGGVGDPAAAPGSPASSYALSGVDHVNYYNGIVNLTIPVHSFGGRGTVAHNMVIPIQTIWEADDVAGSFTPSTVENDYIGGQYTGGNLTFVTVSGNSSQCVTYQNGSAVYSQLGPFLGYMIWTRMDGTQVILRDLKSNGQPQNANVTSCGQSYTPYDRGTVFQSSDGSDVTFVANSDVSDGAGPAVNGTLITRDGTKYIFKNNNFFQTTIEDKNGNEIQFAFSSTSNGGLYTITDPLGRLPTVNFTESLGTDTQDVITYPGFNGVSRTVTVNYALLQSVLASGESEQTYHCLFPELHGSSTSEFNPYVISSVQLADGTSYSIQYNAYGEAARLTLPTGAYYVYKYPEANCQSNGNSGVVNLGNGEYAIHRAIQERDEYANGGTALTAKMLFSWSTGYTDGNFPSRPTTTATVTFQDPNANTVRTDTHYFWGNPAPTANVPAPNPTEFASWWLGLEYATSVADPVSGTIQFTGRAYGQRPCPGAGETVCPNGQSSENMTVDTASAHDPQLCQVNTQLSGSSLSSVAYTYDQYNNPANEYDINFGSTLALNGACPTSGFSGVLRQIQTTYLTSNSTGNYTASAANILSLPSEVKIMDGSGAVYSDTKFGYDEQALTGYSTIVGHDNTNYSGGGTRGNLTSFTQYLNTSSSWITSQLLYDIAGNVTQTTDPVGNVTKYVYTDSYADGSHNSYARVTTATNALGEYQTWVYDYGTGNPVNFYNTNRKETTYQYGGSGFAMDRLTQAIYPDTSQTNYGYPSATEVDSYQDQVAAGDRLLASLTNYDGLGRSTQVRQSDNSGSGYITTTATYDSLGRVSTTTNPSRSGDGLNYATSYVYDGLGRLKTATTADNNVAATAYSGNQVTQTDQLGKVRSYTYDSLGRLSAVVEDPAGKNYLTNYSYDPLGDLTCVNQGGNCTNPSQGGRYRGFAYDTLGRLTTASNPESGSVGYSYYNSGTLYKQTDARGIVTTNTYDSLNRLSSVTYSDGTPSVAYTYGTASGIANSIDQLTNVTNSNSATNYTGFSIMGRVTASSQTTGGQTYTFSNYTYNLAGSLTKETYPSGRVVTTNYDGANSVSAVSGMLAGATTNYLSSVNYWPHGAVYHYTRGNNLWYFANYNNRLQPVGSYEALNNQANQEMAVFCLNWGTQSSTACGGFFPTSADNGTLQGKVDYAGNPAVFSSLPSYTHTYTYDTLNRLTGDTDSGGASRSFAYDEWGNMATTGAVFSGLTPPSISGFSANNRLSSSSFSYDNAGNMTLLGSIAIAYDANSRQISTNDSVEHVQASYSYDGLGNRVMKTVANGATTVYVYDALGQMISEYTNASSTPPCTTCYLSYDHLGSVRMVTDQNANIVALHDYVPFGEEIPGSSYGRNGSFGASDGVSQKFTGQDRDSENTPALDYFNARYMTSVLGRFASPDPGNAGADLTNPQSWNGYAYALNNPLIFVDPSGRACVYVGGDGGDPSDPDNYEDDDNGGQSCSEAFDPASNTTVSETTYGSISGGVTASGQALPAKTAATIIKQGFCSSIPSGRTLGVSGAIGGIGGQAGTLEMVTNYNSGEVSGFASGGVQVGFNGGASANVLLGLISNLGNSNANYSGPFTNAAASVGAFGAFIGLPSAGFSNPLKFDPNGASVGGVTAGASLFGAGAATASVTYYTKPVSLGKIWSTPPGPFSVYDLSMYLVRRVCQ